LLQRLLDEYPGSKLAGPGCLQLAQLQFRERSFDEARLSFRRYIDDLADSPLLTAAAWAGLGAIEEQTGFPENAIAHYRRAVDADPEGPSAPENLRRLVRAAVRAGDTSAASAAYQTLDADFPDDTDNRVRAQQMMIERGLLPPN
jgi:TolA-binding protein